VQQQVLLSVERLLADHRSHDAQLVGDVRDVREQVAHPQSALAPLLELPRAAHPDPAGVALRLLRDGRGADRLALVLGQRRLGVERVDVRRAAVHEQEDDGLGLRGEVGLRALAGGQEPAKREHAEPGGASGEPVAAREGCEHPAIIEQTGRD
jgi:hypothetical protein